MPFRAMKSTIQRTTGSVWRALRCAFYDWTREMSPERRFVTTAGIVMQGYAFYALWTRSLVWPILWPTGPTLYVVVWLLYMGGYCITNALLTSEFVRKTQLESDMIAAKKIQHTLQPHRIGPVPGYEFESYYRPFRQVGGDYFDVIDLGGNRTLLAIADVSGKGMPAALLASNIQALVRSMAGAEPDLAALASRINRHLSCYSPSDRFATAMFIVLNGKSGELLYVNAGHNPAMICGTEPARFLGATGLPIGLFQSATYEVASATLNSGDILLVFTDGLPDSVAGEEPERRLSNALTGDLGTSITNLKRLVDPDLNEDDVTILMVKRAQSEATMASDFGG